MFELELEKEDSHLPALAVFAAEIKKACSEIDPEKFAQEPAYVAGLLGKLAGKKIEGSDMSIEVTVVNDRGPKSAESKYGADFAITLIDKRTNIHKAILGQAKRGTSSSSTSFKAGGKLDSQLQKMKKCTDHFIYFETPSPPGRNPTVIFSDGHGALNSKSVSFGDYLAHKFASCQHGDKKISFVESVQKSNLPQMNLVIKARRK